MQSFKKRMVIVLSFLLIFVLYTLLALRNEYLQFLEIGEKYTDVFITDMKYKYLTMGVNFIVIFLAIYITTKLIKKGLKKFFEDEKKEMPKLPNKSIAFIVGLIASIISTNQIYGKVILFFNSAWFGVNDPIFNKDIGFYMFSKPFLWMLTVYWLLLIIGLVIYTVVYYIVVFNKFFDGVERETLKSNMFIKQLLGNLFLISLGVSAILILKSQDILFERFLTLKDDLGTSLYGAGVTSIIIKLWGYRIIAVVVPITILLVIRYIKKIQIKKIVISLSVVPICFVVMFLAMIGTEYLFVKTNELNIEKKYIEYNIQNTRAAYNLNIEEKNIINDGSLTKEDIENNEAILSNILIETEEAIVNENGRIEYIPSNEEKILINIGFIENVKKVAPFFTYDPNPYIVTTDDKRQIIVLDAYTISNSYPYSQSSIIEVEDWKTRINYIRNSIKILIDVETEEIKFYLVDKTDPIAMAYKNIYTNLFMDDNEKIPEDVEKQIIYPKYLYDIQAQMLERYHRLATEVVYRSDDVWSIATYNSGKVTANGIAMEPVYTCVSNDGKTGLVIPYTLYGKQNIKAYLVGAGSKLTLSILPNDSNVLGPMKLDKEIEQDEIISQEIKNLEITGTKLIKTIITIPIENKIVLVEPIYQLYLNESKVPILKKVVISCGNKIAIGNTVEDAIEKLISREAVDVEIESTDDIEGIEEAIIRANNNLKNSIKNNDWELIGKDMNKLQELIDKLELLKRSQEKSINVE